MIKVMGMVRLFLRYLIEYRLTAIFLGYMLISTLLRGFTTLDYTIPCLIRWTTGHRCYGCGLTAATVHLIHLDFEKAFHANALVYLILPLLIVGVIRHWMHFVRKHTLEEY